jgi:hypothetical protein
MHPLDFFHSHAGKGTVGVCLAGLLIGWPPAFPWIAAVALLQWSARHFILAFKEAERDEQAKAGINAGAPSLDAPDSQRRTIGARHRIVPARSPMD